MQIPDILPVKEPAYTSRHSCAHIIPIQVPTLFPRIASSIAFPSSQLDREPFRELVPQSLLPLVKTPALCTT